MKKLKSTTLGILIGAVTTLSITALADYIVNPNTYPVFVDGEKVSIEGYNINDSTYFKLRDIGDKTGFRVDFANDMILLNTSPLPTPTPQPTVMPASIPLPEVEVEIVDGVQYVDKDDVEEMLNSIGLGDYRFSATHFYNKNDLAHPLLENMPNAPDTVLYIPYDYYISTVIPIINSLR